MKTELLNKASPDFNRLQDVLLGRKLPKKVHIADLFVDDEILEPFCTGVLDIPWVSKDENKEVYYKNIIDCYKAVQFDYVPVSHWTDSWINFPYTEEAVYEKNGLISTGKDYEKFPWDEIEPDYSAYPIVQKYLPEGMKLVVETGAFQDLLDKIVGYENLFFMLHDNFPLLEKIIDRWFSFKYNFYDSVLDFENVGAIWHADDLGSKSASLVSPDFIRKYLFPWYRKYADLAHKHVKMFWFHCCGNIYTDNLISDFIDYVKIDAFHSFQDEILPVRDFKMKYGKKVGIIGGVDVNMLSIQEETQLRAYIRDILKICMKGGRYALGSGNSIARYVPLNNFLVLIEEGIHYEV